MPGDNILALKEDSHVGERAHPFSPAAVTLNAATRRLGKIFDGSLGDVPTSRSDTPPADDELKDAVWAYLMRRSQWDGPAWVIGCVGVAMPGLKNLPSHTTQGCPVHVIDDIVSEMVTNFVAHTAAEVGIAALHHYVDGRTGTPRDHDAMLQAVPRAGPAPRSHSRRAQDPGVEQDPGRRIPGCRQQPAHQRDDLPEAELIGTGMYRRAASVQQREQPIRLGTCHPYKPTAKMLAESSV
ncbi:hypothetical protein [Nonomuraea sp. NPDC003754]